jgi:hypothetical protein
MRYVPSRLFVRQHRASPRFATYWRGEPPVRCECCPSDLAADFIDGKTEFGFWAIMCPTCHAVHGDGKGQRYVRQQDGRWRRAPISQERMVLYQILGMIGGAMTLLFILLAAVSVIASGHH